MAEAKANLQVVTGGSSMPTLNVSNEQKLQAIRDTVAKGATDAEFVMLMHLANRYQLDPFLKEIWFIKYGNTPTIMVSRDGLRNYAQRQEDFEGLISQEVRKGDTFKYNPITGEIHHETGDGSGPITKAYAIVYRKNRKPHIELVDFKEYYDALSAKNPVWKSHPSAMIKKVAEVMALKKCYTITGLYAPEEMGMQEPDMIDVTPPEESEKIRRNQKRSVVYTIDHDQSRLATEKQRKAIFAIAHEKNISDDEIRECMIAITGKSSTKELTSEEASKLIEYFKSYQPVQQDQPSEQKKEHDETIEQSILDDLLGDIPDELDPDQKFPWEE
jgi:phage recombination protein Bet